MNTPLCKRGFASFEDFPSVIVSEVSRFPVPENLKFNYFHRIPAKVSVPDKVKSLLEEQCKLSNRLKRQFLRLKEPIKGIRHGGVFVEYEGNIWVKNYCGRISCFNNDEKKVIFEKLDPYIKKLESLLQEEVHPSALLPEFPRYGRELLFPIPGSGYDLLMGTPFLVERNWLEGKILNDLTKSGVKENDGDVIDIYKIAREKMEEFVANDNIDVPRGYNKMSLYVAGLRPKEGSNVVDWMAGDRFSFKFAEFLYQGVITI